METQLTVDEFINKFVDIVVKVYIQVYGLDGLDKWLSLTLQEQHDVIMTLAVDLNNWLDRLEKEMED